MNLDLKSLKGYGSASASWIKKKSKELKEASVESSPSFLSDSPKIPSSPSKGESNQEKDQELDLTKQVKILTEERDALQLYKDTVSTSYRVQLEEWQRECEAEKKKNAELEKELRNMKKDLNGDLMEDSFSFEPSTPSSPPNIPNRPSKFTVTSPGNTNTLNLLDSSEFLNGEKKLDVTSKTSSMSSINLLDDFSSPASVTSNSFNFSFDQDFTSMDKGEEIGRKESNEEAEKLRRELKLIEEEKDQTTKQNEILYQQVKELNREKEALETAVLNLQTSQNLMMQEKEKELGNENKKETEKNVLISNLERQHIEQENLIQQLHQKIKQLETSNDELKNTKKSLENEIEKEHEKEEQLEEQKENNSAVAQAFHEQIQALEREKNMLMNDVIMEKMNREKIEDKLKEAETKLKTLESKSAQENQFAHVSQMIEKENRIDELADKLEDAEREINKLRKEVESKTPKKGAVDEEFVEELKFNVETLKNDKESLEKKHKTEVAYFKKKYTSLLNRKEKIKAELLATQKICKDSQEEQKKLKSQLESSKSIPNSSSANDEFKFNSSPSSDFSFDGFEGSSSSPSFQSSNSNNNTSFGSFSFDEPTSNGGNQGLAEEERAQLEEQIEFLEKKNSSLTKELNALKSDGGENSKKLAQWDTVVNTAKTLHQQLQQKNEELQKAIQEKSEAEQKAHQLEFDMFDLKSLLNTTNAKSAPVEDSPLLKEELNNLKRMLEEKEKELNLVQSNQEAQIHSLRVELGEKSIEITQLNQRLEELTSKLNEASQRDSTLQFQHSTLQQSLNESNDEREKLRSQLSILEQERVSLEATANEVASKGDEATQQLKQQLSQLQEEHQRLIGDSESTILSLEIEKKELNKKIEELNDLLSHQNNQNAQNQREQNEIRLLQQQTKQEKDLLEEQITVLSNQVQNLQKALSEKELESVSRSEVEALNNQLQSEKDRSSKLNSDIQKLKDQLENLGKDKNDSSLRFSDLEKAIAKNEKLLASSDAEKERLSKQLQSKEELEQKLRSDLKQAILKYDEVQRVIDLQKENQIFQEEENKKPKYELKYVKNVVVKYLLAPPTEVEKLLPVMGSILEFSNEDLKAVKDKHEQAKKQQGGFNLKIW
eukprot:TRINITY_DN605_c0_g1_i2.p1 TRINITY_DN605_c0_g1~~TRINITY_DN605_c0_g1_i2.p1  ORF type:complete len:1117 (+),score=498.79 TRINITY_DN605_c0_g1_i2:150-3500(+)